MPDHGKLGPWRFVVIEGEARDRAGEALANVIANDDGVDEVRLAAARNHFTRAPAVRDGGLHRRAASENSGMGAAALVGRRVLSRC